MFASLVAHQHLPDTEISDMYKQLRPYAPPQSATSGSPMSRRSMAPSASEKLKDLDEEFERTMLRFESRMPHLAAVRTVPDNSSSNMLASPAGSSDKRGVALAGVDGDYSARAAFGSESSPLGHHPHYSPGQQHRSSISSTQHQETGGAALRIAAAVHREVFGSGSPQQLGVLADVNSVSPHRSGGSKIEYRSAHEQAASTATLRGRIAFGYATLEDGRNGLVLADEVANRLQHVSASPPSARTTVRAQYPQYPSPTRSTPPCENGLITAGSSITSDAGSPTSPPTTSGSHKHPPLSLEELARVNQLLRGENDKLLREMEFARKESTRRENQLLERLAAREKEDDVSSRSIVAPCASPSPPACAQCSALAEEVSRLQSLLDAEVDEKKVVLSIAEDITAVALGVLLNAAEA